MLHDLEHEMSNIVETIGNISSSISPMIKTIINSDNPENAISDRQKALLLSSTDMLVEEGDKLKKTFKLLKEEINV